MATLVFLNECSPSACMRCRTHGRKRALEGRQCSKLDREGELRRRNLGKRGRERREREDRRRSEVLAGDEGIRELEED